MTKRFWRGLALFLVVPGLLFVASCAKKPLDSEPGVSAEQTDVERREAEERRALEEERLREERLREEARRRAEIEQRERFEDTNIYFEFDKARLLPEAQQFP